MKHRGLLACLAVILPLLFTAALLAQTSPWTMSISVDPAVIDLTQGQREVTATVAISRTDSAENVLVICSVQSGAVVSVSAGLYPLGPSSVIWVGDVLTDQTTVFSLTARPTQWPKTFVPCAIIEAGLIQHAVTGTVGIVPYRVWLPATLNAYAAPVEPQVMEIANPGGGFLASFSRTSYAEALAGTGAPPVYVEETWNGGWFQSIRWNWPSNTFYAVMRSYLEFDSTALPVGSVISDVSLSLVVKNSDIGAIGDFSAQRGTWSSLTNATSSWNAWEPETLAYQTAVVSGTVVNLTLPITSVVAGGVTKIALRLQPEEVPPDPGVMAYANVFPRPSATLRVTYLPEKAGP
jgi:hypothetical protein